VGPPTDWRERDRQHVESWRRLGVTIGEGCRIYARDLPTEPWLLVIGNDVGIAGGVKFLTHDGIAMYLRRDRPMAQKFGTIIIGDRCFIGENTILLPGTRIGQDVIVGAGSVVRGTIPDNSVVAGNPARVVGRASLLLERAKAHPNVLDTFGLPEAQRRAIVRAHFGLDAVASRD
jgi:acetyltransferase-like isoleucine patch superfamily enzyme